MGQGNLGVGNLGPHPIPQRDAVQTKIWQVVKKVPLLCTGGVCQAGVLLQLQHRRKQHISRQDSAPKEASDYPTEISARLCGLDLNGRTAYLKVNTFQRQEARPCYFGPHYYTVMCSQATVRGVVIHMYTLHTMYILHKACM